MKLNRSSVTMVAGILTSVFLVRFSDAQELSNREIVGRVGPAVVVVQTFDAAGRPLSQGSGFFVGHHDRVATNFHVVTGATTATVTLASGQEMTVTGFLTVSPENDVVILRVGPTSPAFLTVPDTLDIQPGDDVLVIGAPLGFGQTVTSGTVSGYVERDQVQLLQLSAPVSPGSSGSPVVDSRARLVGMVVKKEMGTVQLNFAIPTRTFGPLIESQDSVLPLTELPAPTEEVTITATSDRPPGGMTGFYRFTNLTGYNFVYVWIVENPGGHITGAAFALHETGFIDVIPLRSGKRPGRRRDFELQAGCAVFDGWVKDNGELAGDVLDACEPDRITPFLAVSIVSDPERTAPLEGVKLFRLSSDGTLDSRVGAWFVLVGPKDLGEGTVASLHLWGEIPGGAARRDVVFPRGRADERTGLFETVDRSIRLTVEEQLGRVEAHIFDRTNDEAVLELWGFRSDLVFCFTAADSTELWRHRIDSIVPNLLEFYADSLDEISSELNDLLVRLGKRKLRRSRVMLGIPTLEERRILESRQVRLEEAEQHIRVERQRLQDESEKLQLRLENVWRCALEDDPAIRYGSISTEVPPVAPKRDAQAVQQRRMSSKF